MSKNTIKRINKISTKIVAMLDKLETRDDLTKRRRKTLIWEIREKKDLLNHLCKLYLWGIEK